jgi:hypothetical protein
MSVDLSDAQPCDVHVPRVAYGLLLAGAGSWVAHAYGALGYAPAERQARCVYPFACERAVDARVSLYNDVLGLGG